MKKYFYAIIVALLAFASQTYGGVILKEDFESATSMPPTGWTVINDSQPGSIYHWELLNTTSPAPLSGKKGAYCNSGSFINVEPQKEEWLISPAITLGNESYKLEFIWKGFIASAKAGEYDLQARVSEDNGATWNTVFSFIDKASVEASGVTYPWANVSNKSIVNISAYKNKTIKVAFVHKKLIGGAGKGNSAWLDDILVESYNPITTPIAEGSTSYNFGESYIGSKKYSTTLTLKNAGVDTLKVISVSGLEGTDFSTTINPSAVKLARNQEYSYQASYNPTLTGARAATLAIETNGGTIHVALEGTKKMLQNGYSFEGFEGNDFPPLGWKMTGSWRHLNFGIGGDKSCGVGLSNLSELTTPRLDLSSGNHNISFEFVEDFVATTEESYGPENYFWVHFSTDGGATWTQIFENPITNLNQLTNKVLDLGTPASNNCYVKFVYSFEDLDLSGGVDAIPEYSEIYLDNVILPPLFGSNTPPTVASNPMPANNATDVFNQDLTISWKGSLFATGYKLFVGTTSTNFEVINGTDLGNVTTYALPRLEYNTTYYWKVVPYSAAGEASNVPTWKFAVMSDQTIKTFPYAEGFEGNAFPTLGWRSTASNGAKWSRTNFNPYDGKQSALVSSNNSLSVATLETPEIAFPADKTMQISFVWGNSVPAGLTKSTDNSSVVSSDTLYFEVKKAGDAWKTYTFISSPNKEGQKWKRERIVFNELIGEKVSMRWRYSTLNGMKSTGGSLDNILIEEAALNGKAVINTDKWNAGTVNYKQSFNSKEIFTLLNDGESTITIESITFKGNNFVTSLNSGITIASRESIPFAISFNAGTAEGAKVDTMSVNFTNGLVAKLALSGIALPETTKYFGFEEDTFGSMNPIGFTMIDVDGAATSRPVMINYPNYGNPFAYIVINHKPEPEGADWRNIYPRSGDQVLAALSAQSTGTSVNDWIISEKMTATANSNFKFFAKSYGNSFELSKVTVWVSTTDTKVSSFTQVPSCVLKELPYSATGEFTEFNVNLGSYSGKAIYVALQHTVSYDGFVAFFDDFYYENFSFSATAPSAPEFITEPVTKAIVGEPYTYSFAVNDADGDALTISTVGLPTWLTFNASAYGGTITGIPTQVGQYLFKISASDGSNTVVQEVLLNVSTTDAINPIEQSMIKWYIHSDMLHILGMTEGNVMLYSLSGQAMGRWNNQFDINLSDFAQGAYILKIETNTGSYSTKLIK